MKNKKTLVKISEFVRNAVIIILEVYPKILYVLNVENNISHFFFFFFTVAQRWAYNIKRKAKDMSEQSMQEKAWEELAVADLTTKQGVSVLICVPTTIAVQEHFVEAYRALDMAGCKVILHVDATLTHISITLRE